jgi:pimeloyl-ACP methyl ester carboxylesterase/DNA-binding CsgD family transcriptional regulator
VSQTSGHVADATPAPLLDAIYASALEPERYDELMAAWQSRLETALAGIEDIQTPFTVDLGEFERHFLRAYAILEHLGRDRAGGQSLTRRLEADPRPAMLADRDGRIGFINPAAHTAFGLAPGSSIYDLSVEATATSHLKRAMTSIASEPVGRLLTIVRVVPVGSAKPITLALARAARPDDVGPVALLSQVELGISDRIGAILTGALGLSASESDIAQAIVAGASIEDVARQRNRALETVRTQVKSVLQKVDVRSQTELVRLVAALSQIDQSARGTPPAAPVQVRHQSLAIGRPDGRVLPVIVLGPADGQPAIFLHGMLDGYGATARCLRELETRRLKLIVPIRPGFASSGLDHSPGRAPDRFTADIAAVMDRFGIERCPVVGHLAGSLYAFAAARALGSRVTAILTISGGVPIVDLRQFSAMAPRQRVIAYTARYVPKLLPPILRAGIAQLDKGGHFAFMRALFGSHPADFTIASGADVFPILSRGYDMTVAQGHVAFEIDSGEIVRDWSGYVTGSSQPVTVIHGARDPVVAVESVRAHVARLGSRARYVELPDLGQLLFYARPDLVLDELAGLIGRR